jgi:hypothetical protein
MLTLSTEMRNEEMIAVSADAAAQTALSSSYGLSSDHLIPREPRMEEPFATIPNPLQVDRDIAN